MPRLKKKWMQLKPVVTPTRPAPAVAITLYFALKNADKEVGVSKWILYRMIQRGKLRAAKLGNGKNAELFVRRADFDKAFEKKLAA